MSLTMVCTVASKDPVCWDYGHEHPRAREIPTAGANLGVIQTQSLKSLEKLRESMHPHTKAPVRILLQTTTLEIPDAKQEHR